MSDKKAALSKEQWSEHCRIDLAEKITKDICNDNVPCWTRELLKLTSEGEKCLEIGCGTGQTSAYLSKYGRNITAIDYSENSIALVNEISKRIDKGIETKCLDATKELPFQNDEYDVVFHCGLLEHFEKPDRINMLKNWRRFSKKMISMVPNAASLPYRVGKQIMESNGTWKYGLEIPQLSLADEFIAAGYSEIKEYTIGTEHALSFLSKRHYLYKSLQKLLKENIDLDEYGQGYLLVTIGLNRSGGRQQL